MSDNAIELRVYGTQCAVYDEDGKEITRREGFATPTEFLVKFPATLKFWKCSVRGAKVLSKRMIQNDYPCLELPSFEKTPTITEIVSYKFVPRWHSPASINTKSGLVVYNEYFTSRSHAEQKFIMAHEKGHFYYNEEKYCDLYAALSLLRSGFGLSQCLNVLRKTLKNESNGEWGQMKQERYDYVLKKLKNG